MRWRSQSRLSSKVYLIPKANNELEVRPEHTGRSRAWSLLSRDSLFNERNALWNKAAGWGHVGSESSPEEGATNPLGGGQTREIVLLLERWVRIHWEVEDRWGRNGMSCRGYGTGECMDVGKAQWSPWRSKILSLAGTLRSHLLQAHLI